MSATNNNRNGRGFLSFLRRGQQWLEVNGYHVGDVQEDKPVAVTAEAAVVGNIFAPKIIVTGQLYGSTVALETVVEAQGQIWGDVYTASLKVEPGGKIEGWINSLQESSYHTLHTAGSIPQRDKDPAVPNPLELPAADLLETDFHVRDPAEIDTLSRLQMEAAAALAARTELEQSFEKRLSEVAGEAAAKVSSLNEKLDTTSAELTALREQVAQLEETVQLRDEQVERQANELTVAQDLLAERQHELEKLTQVHQEQTQEFEEVTAAKAKTDTALHEANKQIDALNDRLRGLESAFQASLQHSSEQEESLMRWQELAEVTEKKAEKLENELQALQLQITESGRVTEMLREQRRHAEKEWEKAKAELEALRQRDTKPLTSSRALSDATAEIEQLQADLAEMEENAQEYYEQLLWYKASLETTRLALEQTRQTASKQENALDDLKAKVAEKEKLAEKWRTKATRVAEKANQQKEQFAALQSKVKAIDQQATVEKETIQSELRQTRARLDAHVAEIEEFQKQVMKQGKHLAEIQARLVEREIQLKQVRETAEKQAQFIQRMKKVTTDRIKSLTKQLAHTEKQLQDATARLARRQKTS